MDGHVQLPRLAFGHLVQDGCTKEDAQGATVDVAITVVDGDQGAEQLQECGAKVQATNRVGQTPDELNAKLEAVGGF